METALLRNSRFGDGQCCKHWRQSHAQSSFPQWHQRSHLQVLLQCSPMFMCFTCALCGQGHVVATDWTLTTSAVSCTADLEQFSNPKEGYRIDRPTSWEQTSEGTAKWIVLHARQPATACCPIMRPAEV